VSLLNFVANWVSRSFRAGFETETETDIRDLDGTLVIKHCPPRRCAVTAEVVLALHAAIDPTLPLALNDKVDGLRNEF
jgi:hypothetical protein